MDAKTKTKLAKFRDKLIDKSENIHNQAQTQSEPEPKLMRQFQKSNQKIRFSAKELEMINNIMEEQKMKKDMQSLQSSNDSTISNSPNKTKKKKTKKTNTEPKLNKLTSIPVNTNVFSEYANQQNYQNYLQLQEKQFERNKSKVTILYAFNELLPLDKDIACSITFQYVQTKYRLLKTITTTLKNIPGYCIDQHLIHYHQLYQNQSKTYQIYKI